MAYLLIQLCRGRRGDSSGRDGVDNGGLWWPEKGSEVAVFKLQSRGDVAGDSPEGVFLLLVKWVGSR